jgi:hypothetical protein
VLMRIFGLRESDKCRGLFSLRNSFEFRILKRQIKY